MIIFVIFSERGSGAQGRAWIWTWGLRSLEKKKCEEERLGVSIYIYQVYIRPCFPFPFFLLLFG